MGLCRASCLARSLRVLLLCLGGLALLFLVHGAAAQAGATVSVTDFAFTPAKVQVNEGDTVTWTFGSRTAHTVTPDGGQVDWCPAATSGSCSVAFPTAGTYTYHCAFHPTMTGTVEVVKPATRAPPPGGSSSLLDEPPVARFNATVDGLRVVADGSASSDPDGQVFSWSWSWGDGATGSGAKAEHVYAAPGTYEVRLTVVDAGGHNAQSARSVTVARPDLPPLADFLVLVEGSVASVDASPSSDPEGGVLAFAWDWGDGTPGATGAQATHAYEVAGAWNVTLTVTDAANHTASRSRVVDVAPPPASEEVVPAQVDAPMAGRPTTLPQVGFSDFAQPRVPGPGVALLVLACAGVALAWRRGWA